MTIAKFTFFEVKKTVKGTDYALGDIKTKDGTHKFKIWDELLIKKLQSYESKYFEITYKVDVYNGMESYEIQSLIPIPEDEAIAELHKLTAEDIQKQEKYKGILNGILKEKVSAPAIKLLGEILNSEENLHNRFISEYAAIRMHDASPVGLLHHTTKMLQVLDLSMTLQDNYGLNQRGRDLVYIGLVIHDIGKVKEYNHGEKAPYAKATHRGLGVEILVNNKQAIVSKFDEDFFYELLAIITQHHGVFEEKPHTVFSYLVHLVDMFDTHTTALNEAMRQGKELIKVIDRDIPALEYNQIYSEVSTHEN